MAMIKGLIVFLPVIFGLPMIIGWFQRHDTLLGVAGIFAVLLWLGGMGWWLLFRRPKLPTPLRYQIQDRQGNIIDSVDPAEEDPEVFVYFKARKWPYARMPMGLHGEDHYNTLNVQNTDQGAWVPQNLTKLDFQIMGRARALERIEFDIDHLGDEALKLITRAPRLKSFTATISEATDAGVLALAAKKLERISLSHAKNISEQTLHALLSNPQLKSLYFAAIPLSGACFEAIRGFKNLSVVSLYDLEGLGDEIFDSLATLPNLESFTLLVRYYPHRVTPAGVARFLQQRMPVDFEIDKSLIDDRVFVRMIKHGWLYGPRGRTPEGDRLPKPRSAEEVRSIHLYDTLITDAGFAAIENCVNITGLSLEKTKISDVTVKKLANFPKLTFLGLSQTKVTPRGLLEIVNLPIKRLNLDETVLSEDFFKVLGRMRSLEELHLSRSKFRIAWLRHLRALPKLRELYMQEIDVVSEEVALLAQLPNVREINLAESNLDDAGFRQLAMMPRLESLNAHGSQVSEECLEQMQQQRPGIHLSA